MGLNKIVLSAHSGFRVVVLLTLVFASVKYAIGYVNKSAWSGFDSAVNHVAPVVVDIQWFLGIVLYTLRKTWTHPNMAINVLHPLTMTLSVVVSRIFWWRVLRYSTVKSTTVTTDSGTTTVNPRDNDRFRAGMIGNLLTSAVIAVGIILVIGKPNIFTGSND